MISDHATEWLGFPVRLFKDPEAGEETDADSGAAPPDYAGTVHRLATNWDTEQPIPELLEEFLEDPASAETPAIIIGHFNPDGAVNSDESVQALVAARSRLPKLKGIFFGDIIGEENEMSWINHGDVTPLLTAYPDLTHFRIRGSAGLSFGSGIRHSALQSLAVESGGLPRQILQQIAQSDLPALEELEIWLGTPNYGGDATLEDVAPFLDGSRWPRLKRLGLRNCEWVDTLAAGLQGASILPQLEELDLSLGNLSDEGGAALLANDGLKHLRKLDLHHHYLSDGMMEKLQEAFPQADLSGAEGETDDPDERYISVSE